MKRMISIHISSIKVCGFGRILLTSLVTEYIQYVIPTLMIAHVKKAYKFVNLIRPVHILNIVRITQ